MKINLFKVFHYYQDKGDFIKQLSGSDVNWNLVVNFCLNIILLLFIYGFIMDFITDFTRHYLPELNSFLCSFLHC